MVDIIIPTYKPDEKFRRLIEMLEKQTVSVNKIIVINTEEKYMEAFCIGNRFLAEHKKLAIHHISQKEFDHGKSRNLGAKKSDAEILVFMTQDAVPADEFLIERLIEPLKDEKVACSYARQLPDSDSTMIEKLTREFNYPDCDRIKTKEDIPELGIKTYFCSNVCCAYNAKIFRELQGFINHTIFNEDMIYAAGAVKNGYKIAYAANALVLHSHNYTWVQNFHRNFDLGVSQADHPEVFAEIKSESEGIRLVKQTAKYLKETENGRQILPMLWGSGWKFLGYKLGRNYKRLPGWLIKKCSMNRNYWHKVSER